MSQWENVPKPVVPSAPSPPRPVWVGWSGFSLDPRAPEHAPLRASDADRAYASALLEQAFQHGRLKVDEFDARSDLVPRAATLGELAPLVGDVMVQPGAAPGGQAPVAARSGQRGTMMWRTWVGFAVFFNLVWMMTAWSTGRSPYYWPMWPMLGMGIPLFINYVRTGHVARSSESEADLQRSAAKQLRKAEKHRQKAVRRPDRAGRELMRAQAHEDRAAALMRSTTALPGAAPTARTDDLR